MNGGAVCGDLQFLPQERAGSVRESKHRQATGAKRKNAAMQGTRIAEGAGKVVNTANQRGEECFERVDQANKSIGWMPWH